jgi:hypothetical protein
MFASVQPPPDGPDADLAIRVAKLWPHRRHESSWVKALFCVLGCHRWRSLDLVKLVPGKKIQHCFWRSKVRIDGIVYRI